MSMSGKLEDISVLEVMQLIHMGRKTGTLFLWGREREAAVVFRDGEILKVWRSGARLSVPPGAFEPASRSAVLGVLHRQAIAMLSEIATWSRGAFELTHEARLFDRDVEASLELSLNTHDALLEIMCSSTNTDDLGITVPHSETAPPESRGPGDQFVAQELSLSDEEAHHVELEMNLVDAEREIGRLMKLYVATHQLHASLDPDDVHTAIKDVAVNLLGAAKFLLLMKSDDGPGYEIALSHAIDVTRVPYEGGRYTDGIPIVDVALEDGQIRVDPSRESTLNAVVPLKIQGEPVGAIVIVELLEHVPRLADEDRELLHVLACHAASALYAARLHSSTKRKLRMFERLFELLRAEAFDRTSAHALDR